MVILPLDLTAGSFQNRIIGEEWTTDTESSRLIYPINGCFYLKDLVIRNKASGAPLRPVVDYVLYEINTEMSATNPNVSYFLIHILNRGIQAVLLDYRAVGGQYQLTGTMAQELLSRYTLGGDGTFPFGNITGVPVRVPPEMHDENIQYAYDASMLTTILSRIAEAVSTGDTLALEAVYGYIGDVSSEMLSVATKEIASLNNRIAAAETTYLRQEGEYLITDNDENPAVRLGGFWQLNPDILLYGHGATGSIGDLVPVATGTGVNARYVNIWKKAQDLGQITFSLAASATTINEGGSVVFTLTTTGLSSGSRVPYRITGTAGFSSTDIAPTPLTGFFTVNSSGVASLTINAASDLLTEGAESFTLALSTGSTSVSRTVSINDTSKTPSISLRYSANSSGSGTVTQVNEGQTVYLVITTQNITLPHNVTLQYSGSVSEADLSSPRPTTMTVNSSPLIVPYSFLSDRMTEGNQDMVVNVSSALVTVPVALSLTVRDTSLSPAYSMYFSGASNGSGAVSSRNEGQPFYLVFSATNSDAGENFTIQYSGTSTPADFSGTRPGTLTIGADGKAIVSYNTVLDNLSDGEKTLTVSVFKDSVLASTGTITINDTSQNPQYNAFFSTTNNGSNTVAQVNEGQVFYLFLSTTGIASGTVFTVEYSGSAIAADVTDTRPTSLTVGTNGIGSISYSSRSDFLTEGLETMIATIKSGSTVVATANVQIVDTSVSPTYVVDITSDAAGNNVITQVSEGQTFYLNITTTNVQSGTVLPLTYAGSASNADFTVNRATAATVNAQGRATVTYVLTNDFLLDGAETLSISVSNGGSVVATKSVNIIDTSVPVMYARYSLSAQGTGTITTVNEGQLFYLIINTRGYPQGKTFSATCNLPFGGPDWETNLPPLQIGPLNTNGESGTLAFPIKLANDNLSEGAETATITIRDPNDPYFQVAVSIGVNDTSQNPVYSSSFSSVNTSSSPITTLNEGQKFYLYLSTTGIAAGTSFTVEYSGTATNADFVDPRPTSMTVGSNGTGFIEYICRNDSLTEGFETMTANIKLGGTTVSSTTLQIADTSVSPTYSVKTTSDSAGNNVITQINEGLVFYLFLTATSTSAGTAFSLEYNSGSATNADFVDPRPTAITVGSNGVGSAMYSAKSDFLSEGLETVTITVKLGTATVATASVNIADTSQNPVYSSTFSSTNDGSVPITSVNEGQTFYLYLTTTGSPAGTVFTVEYSGTATNADFVDPRPTSITVGSAGAGFIAFTARNDVLTEGSESMTATIKSGTTVVSSSTIGVSDTSVSPTYTMKFLSTIGGTTQLTQVNEGQTFHLQVETTQVPTGTTLTLTHGGSGGSDFVQALPTTMTTNAQGIATATYVVREDFALEGQETLTVNILRDGVLVGTKAINIVDTSVPVMYARYSLSAQGTGTITDVNEDQLFYLIINTRGYPQGKTFNTTCNLPFGGADWETNLPPLQIGPLNANGESGTLAFPIKLAKDYKTEGNEIATITIRDPNDQYFQVAVSIGVNDSSKTPVLSNYWASDAAGTQVINTAAPGDQVYLVTTTQNLANGETIGVSFNGSSYSLPKLRTPPTTQNLTVSGNRATLPVSLIQQNAGTKLRFQAEAGDAPEITSINEGQTTWLSFSDPTRLNQTVYFGYSIVTGNIEQEITIAGGLANAVNTGATGSFDVSIGITADLVTEGAEVLTISLYTDPNNRATLIRAASILINDTSTGDEIVVNLPSSNSGVLLYNTFVSQVGRNPTVNDRVHFVVGNSTIIGHTFDLESGPAAITVGNWPTGCKVRGTTLSGGQVIGAGGRGAGIFRDSALISSPLSATPTASVPMALLPAMDGGPCVQLGNNPDVHILWKNYGFMSTGGAGGGMVILADDSNYLPPDGILALPNSPSPAHVPRYLRTVIGGGGGYPFGAGGGSGSYNASNDTYMLSTADNANAGATMPGYGKVVSGVREQNGCMPGQKGRTFTFSSAGAVSNQGGYVQYPGSVRFYEHPFAKPGRIGAFYVPATVTSENQFEPSWNLVNPGQTSRTRNFEVVNYLGGNTFGFNV